MTEITDTSISAHEEVPPVGRRWGVIPFLGVAIPGRRSYRVWQRNRDVFFQLWKAELLPPVFEPVMMFLALGLGLGTYVELTGDDEYIQFLGPGVLAMFAMFAAVFEALWGAYFRLDQHGTYDAILATPARPEEIVAGEILWAASRGAINATLILLVMIVLTPFYDLVESPLAILALPVAFLTGVVFGSFGQAYVSIARSVSQLTYFFSLFILPMFWFSGGFFPLDGLPTWASTLAWFTPLYHGVELNRGFISGDLDSGHLGHFAWLVIVTPPAVWLALRTMRRRIIA
ncbi:MAG TPA: ABC transporter permease [Dehalococcoidia bacterium]|jgi:lipooligosaccharide transport system permease protein|nr:ABC transporter permease [Dehalococcoidia bacterium]